ncbi:MAG: penicillin-binding protein [Thermoleophilaceae bacterium]|nr:penicillin-binding protein [Thermoleophilaceae bacterium]
MILVPLACLALVSTIFGMMMAVAHELPALENAAEFRAARNSTLFASDGGPQIAKLTGNKNRILVDDADISPYLKNAVIAIEDRRFYQHKGVDYRGIARAVWADVTRGGAVQGASTITQQFVKNALSAQGDRSVFQKLREAALAYHLERRWSKQKILTQYLNTVYFGNGAYGVESAARTYFGGPDRKYRQNERLARDVTPEQAALIASIIASPSAYDPVQNPQASYQRRNLVLEHMLQQKMISQQQYETGIHTTIPGVDDINPPRPDSDQPYFSSWVTQQLVDRYGAGRVFGGGLKITTSIDVEFQKQAEQAISSRLSGVGPSASLVAIDNKTGEVKAMVGGSNFDQRPFNLATNGHRQPGSSFKPFILAEALAKGYSPNQVFTSKRKVFDVPNSKGEKFVVNNYDGAYAGTTTLANATAHSDNSVYAELGLKIGTKKIARLAEKMGIRTNVSTNPAMTLGGLKEGVTPLEMAYAYSTLANHGKRVYGSMSSSDKSPVAIEKVEGGGDTQRNTRKSVRVLPQSVADGTRNLLHGVVTAGTGVKANLPVWTAGKTGTTENYGDAWFVGFTDRYTVAVWVGYPDKLKYMKTEYHGGPVAGGTFPAEIFHDFMTGVLKIDDARHKGTGDTTSNSAAPVAPTAPAAPAAPQTTPSAPQTTPTTPAPAAPATPGGKGGGGTPTPPTPTPTPQQPPQGTPPPQPPSGGGGGTPPAAGTG